MPSPAVSYVIAHHPALRARRLAWQNAFARWRATPAAAIFHSLSGAALVLLAGYAGIVAIDRNAATIDAVLDRYGWVAALVALLASVRSSRAFVLVWRHDSEHGPWSALPIAAAWHRAAGDRLLIERLAVWTASVFVLGIALAVITRATAEETLAGGSVARATAAIVIAVLLGALVGRVLGWRGEAVCASRAAATAHQASTASVTSAKRLPHVAAWQRAAGIDAGASRATRILFGLLLMSVPGGVTLRTGALMLLFFVALTAMHGALSGALRVIAPLAAVTRATSLRASLLVASVVRVPLAIAMIGAIACALLAVAIGAPPLAASLIGLALLLVALLRLGAALHFRDSPERAPWRVTLSLIIAAALLQTLAPLAALWLLVDSAQLGWRARAQT
jgi:hypothetical protein